MAKRFFLFCAGIAVMSTAAWGTQRSEQDARQLAAEYFSSRSDMLRAPASMNVLQACWTARQDNGEPAFYVFNRGEEDGFIIISAEDRARTVLAYSDYGHFVSENMPSNLRSWLDGYCRAIRHAASLPARRPMRRAQAIYEDYSYTPVAPVVHTHWGQDDPYNLNCPLKNGERCVTGCVATAAAQMLAFHQWPTQGVGSHSYYWYHTQTDSVRLSVDFSTATYDWSLMDTVYNSRSQQSHKEEVAKLMYHLGVSCDMGYGLGSEGGSSAYYFYMMHAMVDYFSYDAGIRILPKDYVGEKAFLDSVYLDLRKGWPVYFSGQTIDGGGHAFICDGIDRDGLVHINWGWNGHDDAYFQVSALDPEDQGTGGSQYAFTESVAAYKNVHPRTEHMPSHTFVCSQFQFEETRLARNERVHFIADTMMNYSLYEWYGNPVLRVYKDGQLYRNYEYTNFNGHLGSLYYYYHCNGYFSMSDLPAGQYEILPSLSNGIQEGVYEPIYEFSKGAKRWAMTVTSDSIFIGEAEAPAETMKYDAEMEDFAEDFDFYYLQETFETDGRGWIWAVNDNGAEIDMLVTLPKGAQELVPGTYQINDSEGYRTIYAGQGVNSENQIIGSFAGYQDEEGYILAPFWYLVSGTVKIDPQGAIVVNALNSHGRTIRCRLGELTESVEEVMDEKANSSWTKVLRNGQLLIERGNRTFNALGVEVK